MVISAELTISFEFNDRISVWVRPLEVSDATLTLAIDGAIEQE
jgi:hypothetical protein